MSVLAKAGLVLLLVLAIAGTLVIRSCGQARQARASAAVSAGQASAATASGVDAVSVVGQRANADAQADATTRMNDAEIRKAEGADAAVAAPARDAGLRALCARPAYRSDPKCVQQPRP